MKRILVIMVMVMAALSAFADGWKNGSIVPDFEYQSTMHITYYERTSGYVGLVKDSDGRYSQIVLKTNVGLFDFDYKTKVVLYNVNNDEIECYYMSFRREYLFNKSFMDSEYRFSRFSDEEVIEFIANGRGYVRFISWTTFDGRVEIKVPCMNNGKKKTIKRKTYKNTPVVKQKAEAKKPVVENKPTVSKQDTVQRPNHPFGEKAGANRTFYQEHKSDYSAYNRQVNTEKQEKPKSKLVQNPDKAKKIHW